MRHPDDAAGRDQAGQCVDPRESALWQARRFFLPQAAWTTRRQDFFRHARLPSEPRDVAPFLTTRLNAAYDRFLATLPANAYGSIEEDGWHLSRDPGEALSPDEVAGVAALRTWLRDKVSTIRLPVLLIAVDTQLDWTRHFLPCRPPADSHSGGHVPGGRHHHGLWV